MSLNIGASRSGVDLSNINKKNVRTQQVLNDLFHSIIKYFKKQNRIIHAHNHQIKKSFKLAKNSNKNNNYLSIKYANKLKILPLSTLSFSFPLSVDIFLLNAFIELFSWFEINHSPAISLKHIYFDGGSIAPFVVDHYNKVFKWNDLLQSQMFNLETLIMRRTMYSSFIFDDFCAGFVKNLKYIDLQIIYNEYDDEKQDQIAQLFQQLKQCHNLEICCLDLIQFCVDYNVTNAVMAPILDILCIDEFMKSINIKKSINKFAITFNELCTKQFEAKTSIKKFIKRTNLNLGSILRINKSFKNEIQQMIMSWFTNCNALNQTTFKRYFDNIQSNRYNDDQNIDLADQNTDNDEEHNIAYYDICGGEVFGELIKILQPQNPVE